jgi:hypothetical protein
MVSTTFSKGIYAYPEHWELIPATKAYISFSNKASTHTKSTGASKKHTQSELWGFK